MRPELLPITPIKPNEILRRNIPRAYVGAEVLTLPANLLVDYAEKISNGLDQHRDTMRYLNADQIIKSMTGEQSILIVDNGKLCAYAHLIDSKDEKGITVPGRKEVGAWLSFEPGGNYGILAMRKAAKLAIDQDAQSVIALVHQDNPANDVMIKKVGTKYSESRRSNYVLDEKDSSQFAMMNVYELTEVGKELI